MPELHIRQPLPEVDSARLRPALRGRARRLPQPNTRAIDRELRHAERRDIRTDGRAT